ncbi:MULTISPECIES: ABC transporter substrate-binding protein [unclassified Paenibacillus]|uniref:ABC transporter substrate-binding protein n=1 Tax=unclassified Paenibacillus TaxID=185978 RepID=UPI000691EF00|nr:ABC transporter substrate-binding protein [Paenibacillus sp. FSL H7-0357]
MSANPITPAFKLPAFLLALGLLVSTGGCRIASQQEGFVEPDPPVELNIWLIPGSGLEPLIGQYQALHPELDIHIQISTFTQLPLKLQTSFAAGYSSPDIASIDISYLDQFKQFPEYFYDLSQYGAAELEKQFLAWKWQEALNGAFIYGLPTDIGPYALLYRQDIFSIAGLPNTAEAVAERIGTWEQFIETGKIIKEKTGKAFVNNLEDLYLAIQRQSPLQYYSPSGELLVEDNPQIKRAWEYAIEAHRLDLSAHTAIDTQQWGIELLTGDFAVMLCPAWMVGHIKSSSPTASGLWNMTLIPGNSANRGGSVLTLPKSGKHPEEAFALIKWLTSPQQQLAVFKAQGNFPSTPEIYEAPEIKDQHDPYFGNAQPGLIYSESALRIQPTYYGPHHTAIEENMLEFLTRVELRELDPDTAWTYAVQNAKKIDAGFR